MAASLRDCIILVVEDEYLIAKDLCAGLAGAYAVVLGSAGTLEAGLKIISQANKVNGAVLDINLRGVPVFKLADELIARHTPFVFATGYNQSAIPVRFRNVPRCEKPVQIAQIVDALGQVRAAAGV